MAILYALVARGRLGEPVFLAEFSVIKKTTNAVRIAKQIVEKIPGDGSYFDDDYIFHVKRTNHLGFLCLAHKIDAQTLPFAFLEEISQEFGRTYGAATTAPAYAMNDAFSKVLSQKMEQNSNPNAGRTNRLRGKMSQLPEINKLSIVLGGEDQQKLLIDSNANQPGKIFAARRRARVIADAQWWSTVKILIAVLIIVVAIAYLLAAFVCHGFSLPTCLK